MPFSFLNAALLAGLAAGLLPILIHLFSRRKVAKIPFSSLQFLEQISRRRIKRVRMTQWIILALRVLAIALLALALSRPAFRGAAPFGQQQGNSEVVIILDRSYSMAAEGEVRTLWEDAQERAAEVLSVLDNKDRVHFVDTQPFNLTHPETFGDPQAAAAALESMTPGYGTTDLAGAVRRASVILDEATALNKELFVISDFQESGVGEIGSESLASVIPEDVRVFLAPLGQGPIDNTALQAARLEGSAQDRRVHVLLSHFGAKTADEVTVTTGVGSDVLGERTVTVGAAGPETGEVTLNRLPGQGEDLVVRISRDRLPVDDVRYLAAGSAGRVPVLLIQEPATPSPYLPLAFSPVEGGRFDVRRIAPAELNGVDLGSYRTLVLDNVTYLPRESLPRLREWRDAGGIVLIALGDQVDLRYYNEDLFPAVMRGMRLGSILSADEATGSAYHLTPRATGHPAFSGFDVDPGKPVTGASFWRIVAVRPGEGSRTLAEFGPGLPALLEMDGAMLLASSLDGAWNNLPTHGAFLPLIHQSVEALLEGSGGGETVVGQQVTFVVDRGTIPTGAEIVCLGPDGLDLPVRSEATSRGLLLKTDPAVVPGSYTFLAAGRSLGGRVVNIQAGGESDLAYMDQPRIQELFASDHMQVLAAGDPVAGPIREARYGREFWKELVAVALLALLLESLLSRRGAA